MKVFILTEKNKDRLFEMSIAFFPDYKMIRMENPYIYFYSVTEANKIHWFEFTMVYLIDKIAEQLAKQPYNEKSWSKYLILQKICNELGTTNPIDFLYDLWKNPGNYSQL